MLKEVKLMTSEETRRSSLRDQMHEVRSNFQDLQNHPAWKALSQHAYGAIGRHVAALKAPYVVESLPGGKVRRVPTNMEEIRFTQGQLEALEGLFKYVMSNASISDEAIESVIDNEIEAETENEKEAE
jgi:hypothetical protein